MPRAVAHSRRAPTATLAAVGNGIGVDDTIHVTHRFVGFRRAGMDGDAAITHTLRTTGSALAASAVPIRGVSETPPGPGPAGQDPGSATGRSRTNVVPRPGALSTRTAPPTRATARWTLARPRPTPPSSSFGWVV
jgi:hypothetical protein